MKIKYDGTRYAFQLWYKLNQYSKTEYIYIIAISSKQAFYFYKRYGFQKHYDFMSFDEVVAVKPLFNTKINPSVKLGSVFGEDAKLDFVNEI